MRRLLGWILFLAGAWMLVSPQALTGLEQLRWMHRYTFPGEVLAGVVVMAAAYFLLDFQPVCKERSDG